MRHLLIKNQKPMKAFTTMGDVFIEMHSSLEGRSAFLSRESGDVSTAWVAQWEFLLNPERD